MAKIVCQPPDSDRHQDDVMAIVLWKDYIFTGSYDGVIKKFSQDLQQCHNTWKAHDTVVYALVADDSRLFSSSSDGEIKEWNPVNCEFKQMTILTSPTNEMPTEVKTLGMHENFLYGGDNGGNLVKWGEDFKVEAQKFTYTEIWSLAASPDGQNVLTARDNDCIINDVSIDYKREEFKETLAVRASVQGRAPVAVDDLHVACVDRSGMNVQLYVYDNAKFPKACLLEGGHDMIINSIALGQEFVVSSGWDGKVVLWSIPKKSAEASVKCESYINVVVWRDYAGKTVYAGGKSGYLALIQLV